jgi:colanic acid/amylovoran biosynthesis glycosyltransferase
VVRDRMRPVIHLVTREYPYGVGEAFVADEATRLARMARVVVVPAFPSAGGRRDLPPEVELDDTLARRPLVSARSLVRLPAVMRQAVRDLRRRPSWPIRPGMVRAMCGYAIRGLRAASWVDDLATRLGSSRESPLRVLSTWSNAEGFGLSLAALRDARIRLVCRTHGFDVDETVYPGGHLPFREVIMEASLALGPISEAGAAILRRRHPEHADRIIVARLGVDPPVDSGHATASVAIAPAGPDARTIATCSRDHPIKRLDLVADAIAAAAAMEPSARWTWLHLGGGGDRLRDRLAARSSEVELVAPGFVPRERIFQSYRTHRPQVFVNLSSSEGVPVTIMEALSLGIPVVATDAGGTGELVDDAVGRLLPVAVDAATAARAIMDVAGASPGLRDAATERWRSRASDAAAATMLARLVQPLTEAEGIGAS